MQVLFIHDKKVEIIGASVNQEKTLLGKSSGNYCLSSKRKTWLRNCV